MKKAPVAPVVCRRLGERIAVYRKRKGISLDELCTEVKISKGNLSDIENGKRDPRFTTLRAIADGLGMELPSLIKGL